MLPFNLSPFCAFRLMCVLSLFVGVSAIKALISFIICMSFDLYVLVAMYLSITFVMYVDLFVKMEVSSWFFIRFLSS